MSAGVATERRESIEEKALDARTVRALTDAMVVYPDAPETKGVPGMTVVYNRRGEARIVDYRDGCCSCPDASYRDVECAHIKRARFALGIDPLPPVDNPDRIDLVLRRRLEEA